MTDTSNTIHPQLAAHAQAYFSALPQLPSSPEPVVMAGVYVENSNQSFTRYGVSKTPTYVLRVGRANGRRSGDSVSFDGVSVAEGDTTSVAFLPLQERGDAAQGDDKATLERLLEPYGTEGQGWARAIAEASDRQSRFERAIADIDGVPASSPVDDEVVLVAYLSRHFTYDDSGAYYAKWQQPQDTARRNFPDDLTNEYKQKAIAEHELDKDNFYAYSVVGSGSGARESLVRILMTPDGTASLQTVYSATRSESQPRNEHCIFYAHAGLNIAVPESARGTLSPELAALDLQRPLSEVIARLRSHRQDYSVLDASNTKLKVSGIVRPDAALSGLPDGVELIVDGPEQGDAPSGADTSGDEDDRYADGLQDHVRVFWCPPDKLVELAAHEEILVLHRVVRAQTYNTEVRSAVNYSGFESDIGGPVGEDVYVGVVDTGIMGDHPAFAGRIHKVWDQTIEADSAHPPPSGRGNDMGQVWDTAADIEANATDEKGHGTHVAGTAAAAVGTGYTEAGMAPAAKLLIVKTTMQGDDIVRGVEWCFREAGDRPCVVNLSLGSAYHGCDGVDDFSLSLRRTFRKRNRGGEGYYWERGRVVCVATGNAGYCNGHTHVDSLANNATTDFPVTLTMGTDPDTGEDDPVQIATITLLARPLPRAARGARIDVRVRRNTATGPASTKWFPFLATGATDSDAIGGTQVNVVNGPPPPGDWMGLVYTQHQRVEIELLNTAATGIPLGTWTIEIRSRTSSNIQVDGYILENVSWRRGHPVFFSNPTKQSLMGTPSATYGVVAVGSMVNRATWTSQTEGEQTVTQRTIDPATNQQTGTPAATVGEISGFTNPGPVRGTSRTIRAMLPGHGVLSAMSSIDGEPARYFDPEDVVDDYTGQMSGTSMACPVATGLIAGMLGKHPTLTAKQVIEKFLASTKSVPSTWDADRYGPGPLDASKLLD